jgi:hypothetical protein
MSSMIFEARWLWPLALLVGSVGCIWLRMAFRLPDIVSLTVWGFVIAMAARHARRENRHIKRWVKLGATLWVLACLAALLPPSTPKPSPPQAIGMERPLETLVVTAVKVVQKLTVVSLHSRSQVDNVPPRFQSDRGVLPSTVWVHRDRAPFTPPSRERLGGLWLWVNEANHQVIWTCIGAGVGLQIGLLVLAWWFPNSGLTLASLITSGLVSMALSVRAAVYWDEFYLNLRHAYNLLHHGVFAINATGTRVEGTVDWLPLVFAAGLGALGVPLSDAWISLSLVGNLLVVLVAWAWIRWATSDPWWGLLASAVIALSPPLIWMGATGFMAVLFAGWFLTGAGLLLYTQRTALGLGVLATLTLVRTEGIALAVVMVVFSFGLQAFRAYPAASLLPILSRASQALVVVCTPFALSCLWRWHYYGSFIPTPMIYKGSVMDPELVLSGVTSAMFAVIDRGLHFQLLIAAGLLWLVRGGENQHRAAPLVTVMLVSAVCTAPYYLGGGDWLSPEWNRYGATFELSLAIGALALFRLAASEAVAERRARLVALAALVGLVGAWTAQSLVQGNTIVYKTVERISQITPESRSSWYSQRVDVLAGAGQLLKRVLPEGATVGSAEEATLNYHAEHPMQGLLGVSDPAIAIQPTQFFNERPAVHRRRSHLVLERVQPDVVALFEVASPGHWSPESLKGDTLPLSLREYFFSQYMVDASYYRVGSYRVLQAMGYHHQTIVYADQAYSLFIHNRAKASVEAGLRRLGFEAPRKMGVPYAVTPKVVRTYLPAGPAFIDRL